jgi:hypothetical protein
MAAPVAVIAAVVDPPIATLCAAAKMLPAATFPIIDWIPAAMLPCEKNETDITIQRSVKHMAK